MPLFKTEGVVSAEEFKYETLSLTHDIALTPVGAGPFAGTVTLTARKPGSTTFESIPDGAIDLASPGSIIVTGTIEELRVSFTGVSGATSVTIQDTQYDRM